MYLATYPFMLRFSCMSVYVLLWSCAVYISHHGSCSRPFWPTLSNGPLWPLRNLYSPLVDIYKWVTWPISIWPLGLNWKAPFLTQKATATRHIINNGYFSPTFPKNKYVLQCFMLKTSSFANVLYCKSETQIWESKPDAYFLKNVFLLTYRYYYYEFWRKW